MRAAIAGCVLGLLMATGCYERDCGVVQAQTSSCTDLSTALKDDLLACCPPVIDRVTALNVDATVTLAAGNVPALSTRVRLSGRNIAPAVQVSPGTIGQVDPNGTFIEISLPAGTPGPLPLQVKNPQSDPAQVKGVTRVRILSVPGHAALPAGLQPLWAAETTVRQRGQDVSGGLIVLGQADATVTAFAPSNGAWSQLGRSFSGGYKPATLAAARLTGTPYDDLVVSARDEHVVRACAFNQVNGTFDLGTIDLLSGLTQPVPLAAGDGAGQVLIAAGAPAGMTPGLRAWRGPPAAGIDAAIMGLKPESLDLPAAPAGVLVADLNGNAALDVAALVPQGGVTGVVLWLDGGGPATLVPRGLDGAGLLLGGGVTLSPLAALDVNGDGRPDLFALTADGKTIWALDQQTGATLYGVAPVAPVSSITTGTARGGGYLVVSAPSTMDVTFLSEQALPQL